MVLVAFDHVRDALDPLVAIARVGAELVVVRVRLDVRLVDGVQAEPVAELEPVRVVRIVRGAHGVDVELLHQPHIPLHQLPRDRAATRVVVVMPVDAGDQHRLAVDEQLTVAYLDVSEAERGHHRLPACAELERVQGRIFR